MIVPRDLGAACAAYEVNRIRGDEEPAWSRLAAACARHGFDAGAIRDSVKAGTCRSMISGIDRQMEKPLLRRLAEQAARA